MLIKEVDFQMKPCDADPSRYDLAFVKTVKPRDGSPPRKELGTPMYGLSFDACMRHIIGYRMSLKQNTYSLAQFLKEYKKCNQELIKCMKGQISSKNENDD